MPAPVAPLLRLPALSSVPGHIRAHEARWAEVGKRGHVGADLSQDPFGRPLTDTGERVGEREGGGERAHPLLDLGRQADDLGLEEVDVPQLGNEEAALVGTDQSIQRGDEAVVLVAEPALGHGREDFRIVAPFDERLEHGPARGAQDVGGDRAELDVGAPERLVEPLRLARLLLDQAAPVADELAQLALAAIGD